MEPDKHWLTQTAEASARRLRDADPRHLDAVGRRLREHAILRLIELEEFS